MARPTTQPEAPRLAEEAAPAVRLESVVKRFGDTVAVDGVDLEVREGEFFSFLGPSGSGKTTCLRMIAGFETPTKGRIWLAGTDVTRLPPYDRDVNTVFQDYALFPHMSVGENVEYGLKVRGVTRPERRSRVAQALAMVRLEGFEGRKPAHLSGGQRQRVALARALVNRPRVLLLDELGTALVAGGLLAFALSFDEIVVTNFTSGAELTLPKWIFNNLRQPRNRPVVNVVAMSVVLLSLIPVYLAQRLTRESDGRLGARYPGPARA